MSDEKLKAVLKRAARDASFRKMLLDERDTSVGQLDLNDAEKALLKSVSREQLEKMINQARKWWQRPVGTLTGAAVILGAAAVIGGVLLPTTGATREVVYEMKARSFLKQIVLAEEMYKKKYGAYGALEDLRRHKEFEDIVEAIDEDSHYEFRIEAEAETYTATARHRSRPDTRRAFEVGPDGEVKEIGDE